LIELREHAGLCNRMREMACAMALATASGQPLVVYWLKNRYLNCSFGRLFEPIEGVRVVDVETDRSRALFDIDSLRYRLETLREPIDLFLGNEQIQAYKADGVDLVPLVAKAKHCVIITYYSFFEAAPLGEHFRPRKDILAEVERTTTGLDPGALVGVHIRGTDNTEAVERSPLESFFKRMQQRVEEHPETRFFLATDDPTTELRVNERFPGRVTARPKVFARDRAEGVRDALIDLLILARCPLILGSYWSSFTEVAAELGGARLEIVGVAAELG
jgi:hypothetical protein